MSYSIYYKPLTIKFSNGLYMPMAEAGESNCYSTDNKRIRDWQNLAKEKKLLYTKDEILNFPISIDKILTEKYKDYEDKNSFGFFAGIAVYPKSTSNTSFNSFKNFFAKMVETCISFNEMKKAGINMFYYYFEKENDFRQKEIKVNTEDEIYAVNEKFIKGELSPYFSISNLNDYDYNAIKMFTSKSPKNGIKIKTDNGFIKSSDKLNIEYTNDINEARFFKIPPKTSDELIFKICSTKRIEYI